MQKYVTNQPYGKNATIGPIDNALRLMQARRTGDWGRTMPESTAAYKGMQRNMAKRQALNSGQYFPNNILERQAIANRRTIESFNAKKQAIDNQQ